MTTTLFTGAGLSRAVSEIVQYHANEKIKMPMAYDMFDNVSAKEYLNATEESFPNAYKAYGKLSDYLFKKYKNRTPHISYETVYSDLCEEKQSQAAEQLEGMIFEHLGGNFPPIRYDTEVLQTVRIIRSFLCTHSIENIISTNPDILLEVAVMGSTQFDKYFVEKLGITSLTIKDNFPEGLPVLSKEKGLPQLESINKLVKLHGSILLLKPINDKNNYLWPERYVWYSGGAHTKYKLAGYKLCVIPPINKKDISYKEEPYKTLFETMKEIIEDTKTLIFFGFGFNLENDKSLSAKLKEIISKNTKLKVIVYDITSKVKEEQFKAKTRRFLGLTSPDKIEFRISKL